jgi:ferritin
MNPNIIAALTDLIGKEGYAANIYLNLVSYFHSNNLPGYSNRMQLRVSRKQARESKIQNYLNSCGASQGKMLTPAPIPAFTSPIDALTFINNDQANTKILMEQIITMAGDFGDIATADFVRSLVEEQTEEEATASELLERTRIRYSGPIPRNIQLIPIDYNLP